MRPTVVPAVIKSVPVGLMNPYSRSAVRPDSVDSVPCVIQVWLPTAQYGTA